MGFCPEEGDNGRQEDVECIRDSLCDFRGYLTPLFLTWNSI